MRPSSSDFNAPHRATSPEFIDFFAREAAEQQERCATLNPAGPFEDVSCRRTFCEDRYDGGVEAGSSANFPVTVDTLRCFL